MEGFRPDKIERKEGETTEEWISRAENNIKRANANIEIHKRERDAKSKEREREEEINESKKKRKKKKNEINNAKINNYDSHSSYI